MVKRFQRTLFKLVWKILRKQGIHAWSLLSFLPFADRTRLVRLLGLPDWAAEIYLDPRRETWGDGTCYLNLPEGARLPAGLVLEGLDLSGSPHLRRLPRRTWAEVVTIRDCSALEHIPGFASRPQALEIARCPRLRRIDAAAGPVHALSLDSCAALRQVPLLPAHGQASRWSRVSLHNLPRLRRISQGGGVGLLRVSACPRLEGLSGFQVLAMLELHRCPGLRSLPRFQGTISGRITDCPGLVEGDLGAALPTKDSTLKVEPLRGACALPPPQVPPSLQSVVAQPLFAEVAFEEDTAWPWPPVPQAPDEEGLERTLRALGLSRLEQAQCRIGPGGTLGVSIGAALSRTDTPGQALQLLRTYLEEAMGKENPEVVQVLIEQAGRFGISLLSLWLAMDSEYRQVFLPLLPPWWAPRLEGASTLEELSEALGGIPGPLVLDGPLETTRQSLGPQSLEGPLWVEGDLVMEDWSELESLPDLMVVTGDLTIAACPALRHFPRRLEVGRGLWIRDLPRLERSVCRARVGQGTNIARVPALRLVSLGSWDV